MLEKIIKIKKAMNEKKTIEEVNELFDEYNLWYNNLNEQTISDKIRYRELYFEVSNYIRKNKITK